MIMAMASAVVSFLEKRNVIDSTSREVYVYGCDIALYTFLSTTGLLVIGALLGRLFETAILVSVFYLNQSIGGGFHASTHTRCFITMVIGLLVFATSFALPFNKVAIACFGLSASILLYRFPLILHKNKRHLMNSADSLMRRSRIAIVAQTMLLLGVLFTRYSVCAQSLAISMLLSAISRSVAVLQQRAFHANEA